MSPESLDPLVRVDWLHSNLLGRKGTGRLGMTILPGKHGPSLRYPGRIYRRELDADLRALRSAGVRRLILLVEDAELERWGDPKLVERAAVIGIDVVRADPRWSGPAGPSRDGSDPRRHR